MKLSKPFIGNFPPGQLFGQNLNPLYAAQGLKGHDGIDFPMPNGTVLVAPCNGKVIRISKDITRGEGVIMESSDIFEYNSAPCRLEITLWHMMDQSIVVTVGQKVITGEKLGLSNNTGQSTGPHLHFSIRPISIDGQQLLAGTNGYASHIDPMPYLDLVVLPEANKYKELQTLLNKWGANLVVDGKFGKLSKDALTKFLG